MKKDTKRLISLLALSVALSSPSNALTKTTTPSSIEIHGHRGARARFPENTMPAFQHALEVGADVIELDLGVTKDFIVVVSHDRRVNAEICSPQAGDPATLKFPLIKDLTLLDVKKYDCGSKRNKKFPNQILIPGTPMPTLDEVFSWIRSSTHPRAREVKFNIETKIDPRFPEESHDPLTFVQAVLKVIETHGMENRVILQSFDFRTLKIARQLAPDIAISALVANRSTPLKNILDEIQPEYFSPRWNILKQKDVNLSHQYGVKVVPWTANSKDSWKKLTSFGVDGIITDDPEALRIFLENN